MEAGCGSPRDEAKPSLRRSRVRCVQPFDSERVARLGCDRRVAKGDAAVEVPRASRSNPAYTRAPVQGKLAGQNQTRRRVRRQRIGLSPGGHTARGGRLCDSRCVVPCLSGKRRPDRADRYRRSEEHTSELQSPCNLVCRLLLEKKKNTIQLYAYTLHSI